MEIPEKLTDLTPVVSTEQFAPNDVVIWREDMVEDSAHPRSRIGDGPFTIIDVTSVPTSCTMDNIYCREGWHHPQCAVSQADGVGHPQWVMIRLPDGTVPQSATTGDDARFSGAWFVRA